MTENLLRIASAIGAFKANIVSTTDLLEYAERLEAALTELDEINVLSPDRQLRVSQVMARNGLTSIDLRLLLALRPIELGDQELGN